MSLESSVRSFYKLDEAAASTKADHFALGPVLTNNSGTPAQVAGKIGNAVGCNTFGGGSATSHLYTATTPESNYFDLQTVGDMTMTVWINAGSFSGSPGLLSNWANSGGLVQWLVWYNGSRLAFRVRSSLSVDTEVAANTFGAVSTSTWYFIAVTRNASTGQIRIRINGTAWDTAAGPTTLLTGTNQFRLGSRNVTAAPFNGAVDAFGFFGEILSDADVDTLYAAGAGLEPPFGAVGMTIDNFSLQTGSWREKFYASRISAKASSPSSTGYVRLSLVTKDDSSVNPSFSARYCRNYYTLPPANHWEHYRSRLDMTVSASDVYEDGFRFYERVYKHNQTVNFDGPVIVEDSLIAPYSFVHPEEPQEIEAYFFDSVINIDSFNLQFDWAPTFGCADLTSNMQIAKISVDADNYILLSLLAGERFQRDYNEGDVSGPHDPTFLLQKVQSSVVVDSVSVVAYFGYDLREASGELCPDVLRFNIIHQMNGILALRIERSGLVGEKQSTEDTTDFSSLSGSIASLSYTGVGIFGPPTIVEVLSLPGGRVIPLGRVDVLKRVFTQDTDCVMAGERDPTGGQIVLANGYRESEDFNRADDPNLGDDWNVIKQTGNGWNIISNKADCVQEGYEYWTKAPFHADVTLEASVSIANNNDLVGLLFRVDRNQSDVCAYGVELLQTGTSIASLRIVLIWRGVKTVLESGGLSGYTQGQTFRILASTEGETITAQVFDSLDVLLATVSTTNDVIRRPGRVGIYGQTGGASQHVTLDSFSMSANFEDSV